MALKMEREKTQRSCYVSAYSKCTFLFSVMCVGQMLKTSLGSSFPVYTLIMSHISGQINWWCLF